jgi:hypothetical protein
MATVKEAMVMSVTMTVSKEVVVVVATVGAG